MIVQEYLPSCAQTHVVYTDDKGRQWRILKAGSSALPAGIHSPYNNVVNENDTNHAKYSYYLFIILIIKCYCLSWILKAGQLSASSELCYSYPYPCPESYTHFVLYPFVSYTCSANLPGHGHVYEWHSLNKMTFAVLFVV